MNQLSALHDLMPLLPELMLACGAMLMLMFGAFIGERSAAMVNGWCVVVLVLAGVALVWLAPGPQILFADEPTGNLDSGTGAGIADLIFALNAERGATLFLVTHEESLARRCNRMLRMADGKILAND